MKIALAQMLVEGGRPRENLERARDFIRRAKEAGAEVVVLPECLDSGWLHPSGRDSPPIPGAHSDALAAAARDIGIMVVAGIAERSGTSVHNSAVLIDRSGRLLRTHRKINELDFARELYTTGTSLAAVDTDLGRIGVAICADLAPGADSIGHAMGHMRPLAILSPAAWAVPPGHDDLTDRYGGMWLQSYSGIAKRFSIPVIGVSNVGDVTTGPWAGWRCIGCSLAIGPDGSELWRGPYGSRAEALHVVDVATPASPALTT
ncbi:MAG: carbon-nitrogen hydrolase family protein [Planctomycetes bacterium]|nr:carbon-nitrogen hydrolase family protein [Planctomycetota bacterium]